MAAAVKREKGDIVNQAKNGVRVVVVSPVSLARSLHIVFIL